MARKRKMKLFQVTVETIPRRRTFPRVSAVSAKHARRKTQRILLRDERIVKVRRRFRRS